ncbi:hypothetical protein REPUB_Repub07fG0192200 [Reevesia pubescens]
MEALASFASIKALEADDLLIEKEKTRKRQELVSGRVEEDGDKENKKEDSFVLDVLDESHSLNPIISTTLVSHLAKHADFSRAVFFFLDTPNPDTISFNSLIFGFAQFTLTEPVFELFNELRQLGLKPDVFTLSGLVKACERSEENEIVHGACLSYDFWYFCNGEFDKGREDFVEMRYLGFELNEFSLTGVISGLFDVKEGQQIHGIGLKNGIFMRCFSSFNNAVMNMYSRSGSKVEAVKMFDEITGPETVSWTERIGAAFDGLEAFGLRGDVRFGMQIQAVCQKEGFLKVVFVGNTLISMYGKCGKMDDASLALEMFSNMHAFNIEVNCYTLASILEAVSDSNSLHLAMQIHSDLVKCGFMLDDYVLSCLITTYGRCGSSDESRRVFSDFDKISVMHFNAMLSTLVNADCHADSVDFFRNTAVSNLERDSKTFSIILKACSAITDLEQGRGIHSLVLKSGFNHDCFVQTAVIDLYCKCGSIGDTKKAIRYASIDNLAAWNSMITGYAQHGCYNDAFELNDRMNECRIEPDEITYLGLLTSCCHAGLVQEAQSYMNSMVECHGLIPDLGH